MRVLTFLHSFEPGGVERVALRLIARWRAMGVDAPLFMGRDSGALGPELAKNLDYAVPNRPPLGSAWCETAWMVTKLPAHIRETRPDVLFCAGSTYTIVALAMKLILGSACPPVVVKISNDLARADLPFAARIFWLLWLRILARFVDRWIVMDEAIATEVIAKIGDVVYTVIADPAIDSVPLLRPNPLRQTGPDTPPGISPGTSFVAVGRLVPQKNHAEMLAAFADARGPHDRLTIIGDGPLRAPLERQARRLGIARQVCFVGHVPNAARAMLSYDALLLTSRYEGIPAVLVEALVGGLRIIATDCGIGVRSLLDDGRLGQLVRRNDRVALASAIAAAPAMRLNPAAARRRAAVFTLDQSAPLYLDAIRLTVPAADPVADPRPMPNRIPAWEHAA